MKEANNHRSTISVKSLFRFGAESILMFLSVLFALFVNEWRQDYNEKEDTQIIVENLNQEVVENRDKLERIVKYHEVVYQNIDSIIKNDLEEETFFDGEEFMIFDVAEHGIIQDILSTAAWEVAKQENLTNRIPYDQASAYQNVYSLMGVVYETIITISDKLVSVEFFNKKNVKVSALILKKLFKELKGQEQYLLFLIQDALDRSSNTSAAEG